MTPEQADQGSLDLRTNRKIIDAFNNGGLAETADWFDEGVRLVDTDLQDPIEGRDAVLGHIESMLEGFDSWQVRGIDMYPAGDRIVSVIRSSGSGEGTRGEMEIEITSAHLTRFANGKVVEWKVFGVVADAFRDVGLDPDDPGDPWQPQD